MTTPACCPQGSWPQLLLSKDELNQESVAKPAGSVVSTKTSAGTDLDIYYVQPTGGDSTKGSILVLPDIYSVRILAPQVRSGDRIGNICDALAAAGYTVGLAGIFGEKPFDVAIQGPKDGDFCQFDSFAQDGGVDWFKGNHYEKHGPNVKAAVDFLQSKNPNQPVGVLGFCFGSWLLSKASATGDADFKCAVGCHPATVLEKAVFGGDEVAMMEGLQQPTRFLWAGNDSTDYINGGVLQKALEKSGGGVIEYKDMLHGWVSRGDVQDKTVKAAVEKSMEEIMEFFEKHMSS